jgi:phosphate:Na+ symporter
MLPPTSSPTYVLGFLFGGVASLLYGVRLISDVLQRDAGSRLRHMLTMLTKYPLASFGVGVFITLLTQSSGAISSLLVGLVSVQLLPLSTAILTLLGSNVGSALVVQLFVFNITNYAFLFVGVGAVTAMLTYRSPQRGIGQAAFGFSLIILGLAALKAGSSPLTGNHLTVAIFEALARVPVVLMLIGMLLTMVFASSVAGIGLVLVLVANGALPLTAALALMLGSNVGSTVTAMLTAFSSGSIAGRRLALVHTGTKLTVALVMLIVLNPLTAIISKVHLSPTTLVAFSHLGFNLTLALVFIPLSRPLANLVEKLLPEKIAQSSTGPRYLNYDALSMPAVALGQATRELLHMTDLLTEMLNLSIHAFEEGGEDIPKRIGDLDDQIDDLNDALKRYLTLLDEEQMNQEQSYRQMALLYIVTNLEAMGDLIDKQWMRIARRKRRRRIIFSDEGWHDLVHYYHEVSGAVQQAFAALAAQDRELAAAYLSRKTQLGRLKRQYYFQHLRRLQAGIPPSVESSALHLDLLNALYSVLTYAAALAHVAHGDLIVEEEEKQEE